MQNVTGHFSAKSTVRTTVSLHDKPNHEMVLEEIRGLQNSSDDNWKDARLTYWSSADLVGGNGPHSGYFVNEHPDGDRDFGTFEGRISITGGQPMMEGTWKYTGGTGKFEGVTGSGKYKGRMTSPAEVETAWEGSYQLATSKTRAA